MTIKYLRVAAAFDGWGLHLWGDAIDATVATTWNTPRPFDDEADARAALGALGNKSAELDLSTVVENPADSGLAPDWSE